MMKPYNNSESDYLGLKKEESLSFSGSKSPRVNGQLRLRENPFSLKKIRHVYGRFGALNNEGGFVIKTRSSYMITVSNFNYYCSFDQRLHDKALLDAFSDLTAKVANVADLIRTRKQTADMVVNRLSSLVQFARDLRKGNIKSASSRVGSSLHLRPKTRRGEPVGARWLEYSYGWKPLVQDIYNILDKGFGPILLEGKGYASSNETTRFSKSFGSPSNFYGQESYTGGLVCSRSVKVKLKATAEASAISGISAWGLDNPALLAWEAIPYSFVIDWFLPVGNYLSAATNIGYKPRIYQASITEKYTVTMNGYVGYKNNRYKTYGDGAFHSSFQKQIRRSTNIPTVPLPSFKNPISVSTRIANQLGLLNVELNKRIR
uniref:Maturation protein n=1 Tax=Ulae virus TaxID=2800947 RepID=A0A8A6C6P1_9VIRU|nr:MAG: maturation protein [Ulae virus]